MIRERVIAWDASGGCENPYPFTVEGRWRSRGGYDAWGDFRRSGLEIPEFGLRGHRKPIWVEIDAPCRRCRVCLARRSAHWAARAKVELSAASRTWFCTLTASPEWQFVYAARASARLEKRGVAFHALSDGEQFIERSSEFGRDITKYLKRIRKESGVPLRYILVAEAHKSGLPHFHMLLHEASDKAIRWKTLSEQWKQGFSQFKLVEGNGAAWYVCKYLSKAALARVRASRLYGRVHSSSQVMRYRRTF